MKRMKPLLMFAAIAVASLSFVSCDDDPWDDPYSHWHGWGDGYNQEETTIYDEADALCGEWYGPVEYTYRDGDGYSIAQFYANMRFARYNTNSANGTGVETDYVYNEDGSVADTQTLQFTWKILSNFYIQVTYDDGGTYVLDANASQKGFTLAYDKQVGKNVFYGYMLGTGDIEGNQIAFDFEAVNRGTRASGTSEFVKSFGINEFRPSIKVNKGKMVKTR